MNNTDLFALEVDQNIEAQGRDDKLKALTSAWFLQSLANRYTYNFSSLGRPIIQYPQDIVAMQELIWKVKPDLIIETGIAHGGSLIMNASMLALIDYCDAVEAGTVLDPKATKRRVLGIDIDIRKHNRAAVEAHPMAHRIDMIQGSAIASVVIDQVHQYAKSYAKILVCLDSNHTHDHVLQELKAYAPLTSKGSYCVVFDTIVEDLPQGLYPHRPWDVGNNPKTAVFDFLKELNSKAHLAVDGEMLNFQIDKQIDNKILISVAPDGYLRRI
jgi:cephalosporin hydroxylase